MRRERRTEDIMMFIGDVLIGAEINFCAQDTI